MEESAGIISTPGRGRVGRSADVPIPPLHFAASLVPLLLTALGGLLTPKAETQAVPRP